MKHFKSLFLLDLKLSYRYGLIWTTVFVVVLWLSLFSPFDREIKVFFFPMLTYIDIAIIGFYFMAAMVFYDKSQKTIDTLFITPVSVEKYFISKLSVLTMLSLAASLIICVIEIGSELNYSLFILGVIMNSLLFTITGFHGASRFNAISDFIIPSTMYQAVAQLCLLDYSDIIQERVFHWFFYLIPYQSTMQLIKASFKPVPTWEVLLCITLSAFWIGFFYKKSIYSFQKNLLKSFGENK